MAERFALRVLFLHIWMAEKDILNAELALSSDWIELLRCGNMHVGDKEMSSLWKQWNISACVTLDGDWSSETRLAMAGIIAQLTRAARIRRDRKHYGTNKCLYTLEPFDTNGFKVDKNQFDRDSFYVLPRLVVTTNTWWRRRGGRSIWGPWRRRRTWSLRSTDSTRWPWCLVIRWSSLCRGSRRQRGEDRPGPRYSSVWRWPPSLPWCSRCPHSW